MIPTWQLRSHRFRVPATSSVLHGVIINDLKYEFKSPKIRLQESFMQFHFIQSSSHEYQALIDVHSKLDEKEFYHLGIYNLVWEKKPTWIWYHNSETHSENYKSFWKFKALYIKKENHD